MTDPLSSLREYNLNKKEIIEYDNQIIFGEFSWHKSVKTNFLIKLGPGKMGMVKEYYTLECLLYFLKNIHLIHPEYVQRAAAANIPAVRRPDRKELLAYLNGKTTTCSSIDKGALLEVPTQVKHTNDNDGSESVDKKPCIEQKYEQKVHINTGMKDPLNSLCQVKKRTYDDDGGESADKKPRINDTYEQKVNIKTVLEDPLSLLRQYNVNKKNIIERDNQIIFGELSWPKYVKTNFRIKLRPGNGDNVKEYYTLECLLYFLKNVHLCFHPEYVQRAAAAKIQAVRRPDRKELLAYLNGEIATSSSIDKSAPLEIPTQVKHTYDNDGGEIAVKEEKEDA